MSVKYHVDTGRLPYAALNPDCNPLSLCIPTTVFPLQPSFDFDVFHKLHYQLTAYL